MPRYAAQPLPLVRHLDLAKMTKSQLAAIYDYLNKDFPVGSFQVHATGLRRTIRSLEANGQMVVDHDTGSPDATEVLPNIWVSSSAFLPVVSDTPKTETRWRDEYIITVVERHNPKKYHSASWQRYELMEDGLTIGQYLDACEAAGYGRKWRGDIIWALERGYIELNDQDGKPILLPPRYADL